MSGNSGIKHQEPTSPWTGLVLGAVLLLIMAVLGITTWQRIGRTHELMVNSLSAQGHLMVRMLEGAARAGMRHGMGRTLLLQTLVEEMMDRPHVRSMSILGPRDRVWATAKYGGKALETEPLGDLPASLRRSIEERLPVEELTDRELVLGRPFRPWGRPRPGLGLGGPPGWEGHMMGRGMGRGMGWGRRDQGQESGQEEEGDSYALVRLSTAEFTAARGQAVRQALVLAGIIFLGAGLAALGLWTAGRRRAEEIARLRQEMAESEHLAAVGRLAGSVAHEVRNPLSAMRGLVQLLAKEFPSDSPQAEYAQVAVSEVDRLERVVSGLLEYTRPRPSRPMEMSLSESLAATLEFLGDDPRAQGVEMSLEMAPDLPLVWADPDQLRQVLVNLIVNALEAVDGSGRVSLGARLKDGRVLVEVSDNGPGLPTSETDQLFDPFFSTKERGSGLGLAIARRMVRAQGGELIARNGDQGGAVFSFDLPLAPGGSS